MIRSSAVNFQRMSTSSENFQRFHLPNQGKTEEALPYDIHIQNTFSKELIKHFPIKYSSKEGIHFLKCFQSVVPSTFLLCSTPLHPSLPSVQSMANHIPPQTPPVSLWFASFECLLGKTPNLIQPNTLPPLCLLPSSCSRLERNT